MPVNVEDFNIIINFSLNYALQGNNMEGEANGSCNTYIAYKKRVSERDVHKTTQQHQSKRLNNV
jgi:hypothetical protein